MTRFPTLSFERQVAAPVATLWQAWISPEARAIWSAPSPEVTVEILSSDPKLGGREISLCRSPNAPEIRVESGWLAFEKNQRCVNYEVVSVAGITQSVGLITAGFETEGEGSRLRLTVQLSSLAADMAAGYSQGFDAGIGQLGELAERTMVISRKIKAPRSVVWGAWANPESLPKWWGPDGFSCRTNRIDLRSGGEWVFDMIGPDGTIFPNHHRYTQIIPEERLSYQLLWGENGPKHADAWASFAEEGAETTVTLCMVFASAQEYHEAKGFGAIELGLQTLGKLARVAEG